MWYAIAFILGFLVAKAKPRKNNIKNPIVIRKKITDEELDNITDKLDNVILDIEELRAKGM